MDITDRMIRQCCSQTIYKRGTEYFHQGRVHIRRRSENSVGAIVDGESRYNVSVSYDGAGIEDYMCTCPYYRTMDTVCKHIVAVLKQRQYEIANGGSVCGENDKLASMLCDSYENEGKPSVPVRLGFTLYAQKDEGGFIYSLAAETSDGPVNGIENFLEHYISRERYLLTKNVLYVPGVTEFTPDTEKILNILAENYQNKSGDIGYYRKEVYRTFFGAMTAGRLLPVLARTGFRFRSELSGSASPIIYEEDPDIIIDVSTVGRDIALSVSDRGIALTPDGEWFLFEDDIYRTTKEWQAQYMPIYRVLNSEERTEFSFSGDNAMSFIRSVLPKIRSMHGVVLHGVDDIVVNAAPVFKIYLDAAEDGALTAAACAVYGDITVDLNGDDIPKEREDKLIIRDIAAENDIKAYFSRFEKRGNLAALYRDEHIYSFITESLPELESKAQIFTSERFELLRTAQKTDIHASVSFSKELDLLEVGFDTELSPEELSGLVRAVVKNEAYYRLKSGRFADLSAAGSDKMIALLSDLDYTRLNDGGFKVPAPKYKALYMDALARSGAVSADEGFKEYIDGARKAKAVVPEYLSEVLRGYQKEGLNWFKQLSELGLGGILADDMGLGKTLQVIAYIIGEDPRLPVLVVVPSSLVYNWFFEIKKFAPEETAVIIEGSKENRRALISGCGEYRFVITSYALLRRDSDEYAGLEFSYCFIDEAQNIKNSGTVNARAVKRIKAAHKFALTGTPIENSLSELWSIFDFTSPGYLGRKESFKKRFENPITREDNLSALDILKAKTSPFILRRMKSDVLSELPDRIEYTMTAEMTDAQKDIYLAYLHSAREQAREIINTPSYSRLDILTLLTRLRQICCHPRLISADYTAESGKLILLDDLISTGIAGGHRILIFSQFTSMLAIIDRHLSRAGVKRFYLDGSTPPKKRVEYADRFNNGEGEVFLVSLRAGGTGLNLIGADTVIHYDPWWNPAVTDQASDRAYRIGQTKAVQVIRLSTRGTIEEKILKLQERKRALANEIIASGGNLFSFLSDDEILSLFED